MTVFTLTLDDMSHTGDAVGRYQGRAVFVPLAIPGETVSVEVTEERKRYLRARVTGVSDPSPERVSPLCRYFGQCGGCQWQHMAYPAQLRFKQAIVADQLRRFGLQGERLVRPTLGMRDPWGYRNHVQLAVHHAAQLGYQAFGSHDVIPVDECWIIHELLEELWAALDLEVEGLDRVILRAGIATGEQMLILEGPDEEVPELAVDLPVSCLYWTRQGELIVLAGSSAYHERLCGREFRVSGPSFFQVNTLQAERLIETVRRYLALQADETLLDAYCGVGVFALSLAGEAKRVVGIESSPWAIADAWANRMAGEPVEFLAGEVETVLPRLKASFDAVVLDPPRAGCTPAVLEAIAACNPRRIVYVSCYPATLARDAARWAARGFRLVEVQPIDMFPQTYHTEAVALLCRA